MGFFFSFGDNTGLIFNSPVLSAEQPSLWAAVWRYAARTQFPSYAPPYSSSSSPFHPGEKTVIDINKLLQMQRNHDDIFFPLSCFKLKNVRKTKQHTGHILMSYMLYLILIFALNDSGAFLRRGQSLKNK